MSRSISKTLTAALVVLILGQGAQAEETSVLAAKDSFLRLGAPNTNEGANRKLNIRKVGKRRALLAFDLSSLSSQIPLGEEIADASLELFVTNNNQLWTRTGRRVAVHQVLADWTEGNGSNASVPRTDNDEGDEADVTRNRGTGAGVTWKCATDSNIANKRRDCQARWEGASVNSTPTDAITVTNSTRGLIDFDVTADVKRIVESNASNFGWLARKRDQDKKGGIWIASREARANQPQLKISFGHVFDLTGSEEVPAVTTTATGSCAAWLNNDETELNVKCTHTVRRAVAAHVHDGAVGVDGSVVCDLGNGKTPINGTCAMTADLVTKFKTGGLYVNVHSAANLGGEIRGQIQ